MPDHRKINVVINVHAHVTSFRLKCRQDFVDPRRKVNEVKVCPVSNSRLEVPRGNFQAPKGAEKGESPRRKPILTNENPWRRDREKNRERMYEIRGGCSSNTNVCQMTSSIHGGQALFEPDAGLHVNTHDIDQS